MAFISQTAERNAAIAQIIDTYLRKKRMREEERAAREGEKLRGQYNEAYGRQTQAQLDEIRLKEKQFEAKQKMMEALGLGGGGPYGSRTNSQTAPAGGGVFAPDAQQNPTPEELLGEMGRKAATPPMMNRASGSMDSLNKFLAQGQRSAVASQPQEQLSPEEQFRKLSLFNAFSEGVVPSASQVQGFYELGGTLAPSDKAELERRIGKDNADRVVEWFKAKHQASADDARASYNTEQATTEREKRGKDDTDAISKADKPFLDSAMKNMNNPDLTDDARKEAAQIITDMYAEKNIDIRPRLGRFGDKVKYQTSDERKILEEKARIRAAAERAAAGVNSPPASPQVADVAGAPQPAMQPSPPVVAPPEPLAQTPSPALGEVLKDYDLSGGNVPAETWTEIKRIMDSQSLSDAAKVTRLRVLLAKYKRR